MGPKLVGFGFGLGCKLVLGCSLTDIYLCLPAVTVAAKGTFTYFSICKAPWRKEEPMVENNVYYDQDLEYYDEHDNRVEDTNDYYGSV